MIAAQLYQDSSEVNKEGRLQDVASSLDGGDMKLMASGLEKLLCGADKMQYPSQQHYPNIPHDMYTEETAHKALRQAREIFERVDRLINGIL